MTAERTTGLSRTADGRAVPLAAARLRGVLAGRPVSDRLWGWAAPVLLTLLAFGLRLHRLGQPREFAFDETYYAKDAWSLLNNGFVQTYLTDADGNTKTDIDADIVAGHTTDLWTGDPSLAVHPEVGKWLIAVGEHFFGMDPFGWRIASAVVGSLMVLVMCRLVRRMTGSTMLGCVAGLLLMLDGLHLVLSRLALLDIFLAFFILCAVHCVVADRDWLRRRLADDPLRRTLWRPWLLVGGICWGLALGTKWTAIYPLAAFGLLCWLWSAGARHATGSRWAVARSALVDGVPAFVHLVVLAAVVYVASWSGWLTHASAYEDELSATQYRQYTGHGHCGDEKKDEDPEDYVVTQRDDEEKWPTASQKDRSGVGELTQSLRSLWYYHQDVYTFHSVFLQCSEHTYMSMPSGWLLLNRPVGVAVTNDIQPGTDGCDAPAGSHCLRQVLLLGTPTIWWGGCLALIFALVMWVGARDWRWGVPVVGATVTWLPWLLYDDRPIFLFYASAILPFVVIALTLTIGTLIGPSREPTPRRTIGVVVSGAFVVLTVVNFAWFWPIWTNGLLTNGEWLNRIWFSRWI